MYLNIKKNILFEYIYTLMTLNVTPPVECSVEAE